MNFPVNPLLLGNFSSDSSHFTYEGMKFRYVRGMPLKFFYQSSQAIISIGQVVPNLYYIIVVLVIMKVVFLVELARNVAYMYSRVLRAT